MTTHYRLKISWRGYCLYIGSEIHFKISTSDLALVGFTQQARDVDPTQIKCWINVYDIGQNMRPALAERFVFAGYGAANQLTSPGMHDILTGLSGVLGRPVWGGDNDLSN